LSIFLFASSGIKTVNFFYTIKLKIKQHNEETAKK